ncbi:MAG TPA: efflux RND transporter periplasmic adaptor subunit [Pseudomonas sp.]|nr:efflux RND transporter periplasmic adaptor subunit [Pseudomonas sp.]
MGRKHGVVALLLASMGLPALASSAGLAAEQGRIRTQLISQNEVAISSELAAKIAQLPLREGHAFSRGQLLVGFDCDMYQAQLRKAQASAEAASSLLGVNRRLAELNSVGSLEVEQAAMKLKEAEAEVAVMKSTVAKCQIKAPFNGRVAKRLVAAHQYVAPGTPLLELVDTSRLELQMIVPSKWLAWLKPGTRFQVQVDELGQSFPATVSRVGARINAVSQSVTLTGSISGAQGSLLPGMSGWASFTPPTTAAR